jgi:hypothetical protein
MLQVRAFSCCAGGGQAIGCSFVPDTPVDCFVNGQNVGSICGLTTEGQVICWAVLNHSRYTVSQHYHGLSTLNFFEYYTTISSLYAFILCSIYASSKTQDQYAHPPQAVRLDFSILSYQHIRSLYLCNRGTSRISDTLLCSISLQLLTR